MRSCVTACNERRRKKDFSLVQKIEAEMGGVDGWITAAGVRSDGRE